MHLALVCIYASLRRVQLHLLANFPLGSCRQQQDLPLSCLIAQTPQFFQHLVLHAMHQPHDFLSDFLVYLLQYTYVFLVLRIQNMGTALQTLSTHTERNWRFTALEFLLISFKLIIQKYSFESVIQTASRVILM